MPEPGWDVLRWPDHRRLPWALWQSRAEQHLQLTIPSPPGRPTAAQHTAAPGHPRKDQISMTPAPTDVIAATQQRLAAYTRTLSGSDLDAESRAAWYLHKTITEQLLPLTLQLLAERTDLSARLELARDDAAAILPTRPLHDLPGGEPIAAEATRA